MYMHHENFMLPLSHDEVVHGKSSLIFKMKGDEWQKHANLRALYTYMYTHPGNKLLFMGGEFGQTQEWDFSKSLDWHLLQYPIHKGLQNYVKQLNLLFASEKALFENNFSPYGFEWIEADDDDNSIFVFLRKGKSENEVVMSILNLTPRSFDYKIGIEEGTKWKVILNSDDQEFGGSGVKAEVKWYEETAWMRKPHAMVITLPPLSGLILKQVNNHHTK